MQSIVIAGESLHVPQRHGQRHRKALLRNEQGRTVSQAHIQGVRVPVRFRLQQPVAEAEISTEMLLELVRVVF